eukprot:10502246-Ditylum_brightwellii.AAC.1
MLLSGISMVLRTGSPLLLVARLIKKLKQVKDGGGTDEAQQQGHHQENKVGEHKAEEEGEDKDRGGEDLVDSQEK